MKFNYFSFVPKKLFVAENAIIPARLNIIVKKILISILFSIIPEARYEINIIKNSIKNLLLKNLRERQKPSPLRSIRTSPGTENVRKILPDRTAPYMQSGKPSAKL